MKENAIAKTMTIAITFLKLPIAFFCLLENFESLHFAARFEPVAS